MSQTPNLLITEIDANQSQKEVTANNAFVELDGAITALLSVAMSDADYTLSTTEGGEALGHAAFVFTGTLSADRHIIVPSTPKFYAVQNDTSAGGSPAIAHNLIVKTSGGSGTSLSQSSTGYVLLYCDGTNVLPVGVAGGGFSTLAGDSDVDITSPSNGDVLTYNTGASKWENQAPSGGGGGGSWSASTAKRQALINLANMVWVSGLTASSTPENQALGTDVALMNGIYSTWVNPDATHGGGVELNANGGAGSLAGIRSYTTAQATCAMGQNVEFMGSMYLSGTASDVRFWFGLTNGLSGSTLTQFGGNDTASASGNSFIGFRFSTNAGDTDWMCVTSDGSTDNVQSSGVAQDSNGHRFAAVVDDGVPNAKFYIDGNLVATSTTHLPTSGMILGYVCGHAYVTSQTAKTVLGTIIIQSDF